jgi:hypothetical protein
MAGPILYSTNPWIAWDVSSRYREGQHVIWCSEFYDPRTASFGSASAAIAPNSSPAGIYGALKTDCENEERNSSLIRQYRKTFTRLAAVWLASGEITQEISDEIVTTVRAPSWRIWRPVLYIIPRQVLDTSSRVVPVEARNRSGYGPEWRIFDLMPNEFDVIELA